VRSTGDISSADVELGKPHCFAMGDGVNGGFLVDIDLLDQSWLVVDRFDFPEGTNQWGYSFAANGKEFAIPYESPTESGWIHFDQGSTVTRVSSPPSLAFRTTIAGDNNSFYRYCRIHDPDNASLEIEASYFSREVCRYASFADLTGEGTGDTVGLAALGPDALASVDSQGILSVAVEYPGQFALFDFAKQSESSLMLEGFKDWVLGASLLGDSVLVLTRVVNTLTQYAIVEFDRATGAEKGRMMVDLAAESRNPNVIAPGNDVGLRSLACPGTR
jgi:hypothetical protein